MASLKTSQLFKHSFIGEMVEIITKSENKDRGIFIVQGYLLDYDEDYYYIGEDPLAVSGAIKRDIVSFISIVMTVDPGMEVLEEMPIPKNTEEAM
jgi:hypothetical protein